MTDNERARAMVLLASVELNLSELHSIDGWWESIGPEKRHELLEFQGDVRAYQHSAQNRVCQPLTD